MKISTNSNVFISIKMQTENIFTKFLKIFKLKKYIFYFFKKQKLKDYSRKMWNGIFNQI